MFYKKKVLLIHHSGVIGGAGVSLLHILRSMQSLNLDVIVYCPDEPESMMKEITKLGFKVISKPADIPAFQHYSGSNLFILDYRMIKNVISIVKSKKYIKKMITDINPDIVIVNSMTLSYIGKIAKSMNIETICFHRETYIKGLFGFRTTIIKNQLSNNFDKVVFISRYDLQESGKMRAKTFVITDKVILDEYKDENINTDDIVLENKDIVKLLYVGGMNKLKGAEVIIKALALCDDNIHLLFLQYSGNKEKKSLSDCKNIKERVNYLLGRDYAVKVMNLIDKYNLWGRIHFYDSTSKVSPFFSVSDIVIFPSTSPHQARPVYEAGAAKKPIIITESPNIREFVENGKNGLTFKCNNYKKLACCINKLANDNSYREKIGDENFIRTYDNHNYNSLSEELERVLKS